MIDFSVLPDDEIKNYFANSNGQQICGRFQSVQLDRIIIQLPNNFFKKRIPFWQKTLIILLICFGQSILSFEIGGYSGYSNLYAQSSLSQISPDQKPKKKLKKKRKQKSKFRDLELQMLECTPTMVLGYTQTVEQPSLFKKEVYGGEKGNAVYSNNRNSRAAASDGKDDEPEPNGNEKRHFEAILSVVISKRNSKAQSIKS